MRLFPALLRKPASDIYLRDYLIGGVVRIDYAGMNSNRWLFLAVAILIVATYVLTQCRNRYYMEGSRVIDTWTGDMYLTNTDKAYEFQRPLRVKRH
jgi:hypothetical protein